MHHYHTNEGHINKQGNVSQAFVLVITIKIDNSPYILLLYNGGLFVLLYGMFVITSSYKYTFSIDI